MVLELKKIFLNENESLSVKTEFDMSEDTIDRNIVPEKISADIKVSNHAGMVVFEADVRFGCRCVCDRCCEPFDYMLDTDALLRDDILLELPSKLLCKDSCKGLCPKCGKNLNEGECGCIMHEGNSAFAVLSKLLEE